MNVLINKATYSILCLCGFLVILSCSHHSNKKDPYKSELSDNIGKITKKANGQETSLSDSLIFNLKFKNKVIVYKNTLSIESNKGQVLSKNEQIIRNNNKRCISQGFKTIISKSNFFTIEQQNCSNKYLINEYITFKYASAEKNYLLYKLGFTYTDRTNPERNIPKNIFSENDFGEIRFSELKLDSLYIDLVNR